LLLQLVAPQTLLIESAAGAKALQHAKVTLRNTGSTVLFFSWSRVPRGETVVSANGAFARGGGCCDGGAEGDTPEAAARAQSKRGDVSTAGSRAAAAAAKHAALQNPGGRFFCPKVSAGCDLSKQVGPVAAEPAGCC